MSAPELTEKILKEIGDYDTAIINYANPDMVGHTGVIPAVIKAVETIDTMVGKLYDKVVKELGGIMFITADHGNSDQMLEADGSPMTKHSMNPVPIVITSKDFEYKKEFTTSMKAKLADIAPTLLTLMEVEVPEEMTGDILVNKK
jgi:2,3-bisphosphoglycerate-independent phosphoglycerate mutase